MRHIKPYQLFESENDSVWYHGSDSIIDKFSYDKIMDRSNDHITMNHGYGIYFSDDEDTTHEYGKNTYKVTISKDADLIDGSGRITKEQANKVLKTLLTENKIPKDRIEEFEKWLGNPTYGKYDVLSTGDEFYWFLSNGRFQGIKNTKDISDFLLRAGIDGMKITNDVDEKILLIFNDKVINTITKI